MRTPPSNPAIVNVQQVLDQFQAYDTIIDVRTPAEFEEDHLPGAINLPVLDNDQRILVGTGYKGDPFTAKKIGAALMSRNIAHHLEQHLLNRPKDWSPLVYCWRGGNRSGGMATVLAKIGWRVSLLEGGYKAYRTHLMASLPGLVSRLAFRVVCGPTGSGKTRLLGCLAEQGQQVLDLEALACHRGSLLGAEPSSSQPSQKAFESLLFDRLRTLTPDRPVYVESESKKIGNLHLPDALMTQMRASDCIRIEMPTTARVCLLCEEYQHFLDNPGPLIQQLQKMAPLVGHGTVEGWLAQVTARDWPGLVGALLAVHYDPSYHRSIQRNFLKIAQATTVTIATAQRSDYEAAAASLSA